MGSLKINSVQGLRYRLGVGSRIGCHRIIVTCSCRDADGKQETLICLQCSVKTTLFPNKGSNCNHFIWRIPVKQQQLLSAPLCCFINRASLEVTFNLWLTLYIEEYDVKYSVCWWAKLLPAVEGLRLQQLVWLTLQSEEQMQIAFRIMYTCVK